MQLLCEWKNSTWAPEGPAVQSGVAGSSPGWKQKEVAQAEKQLRDVYNAQYAPERRSRLDLYLASDMSNPTTATRARCWPAFTTTEGSCTWMM
jgi:hypothetical protein